MLVSEPFSTPPAAATEAAMEQEGERIHRAESYRRIIEAAENGDADGICFFNRFKPTKRYGNIERVPWTRSIKIFEFFNVRRAERRIYETYPEDKHLLKLVNKDETASKTPDEESSTVNTDKPVSPRREEDKRLDRRFWKQLSRRRSSQKGNIPV
ncbi:unnamed protein product [Brassicogethes aeneus]|uniref:Uncharacterized protein n=1 Tax=Brassicogethes aeneus TaxID=1431903 RepID=A0A9P0AYR5_BRAAE|nr:unnamed protein product [Brassicogethes aeneus]